MHAQSSSTYVWKQRQSAASCRSRIDLLRVGYNAMTDCHVSACRNVAERHRIQQSVRLVAFESYAISGQKHWFAHLFRSFRISSPSEPEP